MSLFGDLFDSPQVSMSNESSANVVRVTPKDRWSKVDVVSQAREDRMPESEANVMWTKIYTLFGATGETARDRVFAAVNGYFAINGCSPTGDYVRSISDASGQERLASDVVRITGKTKGDIRRFLRGKLKLSYECLKHSRVLHDDEAALARAELRGIPRQYVYLLADWLSECEFLTAGEEAVYRDVSAKVLAMARRRRKEAEQGGEVVVASVGSNEREVEAAVGSASHWAGQGVASY